jgi:hypothetical protein
MKRGEPAHSAVLVFTTTGLHRRETPSLPRRRITLLYTVAMVDFSTKPKWLGTSLLSLSNLSSSFCIRTVYLIYQEMYPLDLPVMIQQFHQWYQEPGCSV